MWPYPCRMWECVEIKMGVSGFGEWAGMGTLH